VKRASLGLVAAGVALLVVGILGDSQGWWQSRPFLTNIVSTLAGACFGLPVLLLQILNG
jgi:ABC-type xylose transport system permease subunit